LRKRAREIVIAWVARAGRSFIMLLFLSFLRIQNYFKKINKKIKSFSNTKKNYVTSMISNK
jgi:hypothetical protein